MNKVREYNGTQIEKSNGGVGSYTPRWYVLKNGERLKRFSTLKAAKQFIDESK